MWGQQRTGADTVLHLHQAQNKRANFDQAINYDLITRKQPLTFTYLEVLKEGGGGVVFFSIHSNIVSSCPFKMRRFSALCIFTSYFSESWPLAFCQIFFLMFFLFFCFLSFFFSWRSIFMHPLPYVSKWCQCNGHRVWELFNPLLQRLWMSSSIGVFTEPQSLVGAIERRDMVFWLKR